MKGKEGQVVDYPDEGAVFRSNPDGTEFEMVARGLRNPQELVFDEHGNLFTGDNDSDQGDMERLVYLVEGGDSGWRVGYQHAPLRQGRPVDARRLVEAARSTAARPIYCRRSATSRTARPASPTTRAPASTPKYAGHFFITHFKGSIARSGIQTYTLKQNGATFAPTSSQQFMGGVLPTDVTFGPDGVLYLADWVDGWPKSKKGRIYGITPVNPDPAQVKISADLAKTPRRGLHAARATQRARARCCRIADRRARLEAQLELASRGEKSVEVFAKVLNEQVRRRRWRACTPCGV